MAVLIAIEGADRMGKATQAAALTRYLRFRKSETMPCMRAINVEMPYDDGLTYGLIYRMLGNGAAVRFKTLFQTLQFANKAMFQAFVLPRLRRDYDFIIADRWRLSALIYGNVGGVNRTLNRLCYSLLAPADFTIVFYDARLNTTSEDVYEADTTFQNNVRCAYRVHASLNFEDHAVVKNTGTVEQVHARVVETLLGHGMLNTTV
jgi:thymidylate kinase